MKAKRKPLRKPDFGNYIGCPLAGQRRESKALVSNALFITSICRIL
jgi:hypothetical protein